MEIVFVWWLMLTDVGDSNHRPATIVVPVPYTSEEQCDTAGGYGAEKYYCIPQPVDDVKNFGKAHSKWTGYSYK